MGTKKQYKTDALKFHPDKNSNPTKEVFLTIQQTHGKVHNAYNLLGSINNDERAAVARLKRKAPYNKKKTTEAAAKELSPLENTSK
eukprot:5897356-Ditylum_brightwellii.AAC.1